MNFFKSRTESVSLSINYINEVGESMGLYVYKGGLSKHIELINIDNKTVEWSI